MYPWPCISMVELLCISVEIVYMIMARNLGMAIISAVLLLVSLVSLITVIKYIRSIREITPGRDTRCHSIQVYQGLKHLGDDFPPDYDSVIKDIQNQSRVPVSGGQPEKRDRSHWVEQLPSTKCYI